MTKKTLIIIGLQTVIIVVLFWVLVFYGKDEYEAATSEQDEVISSPSLVTTENGAATVTLSPESQKQSGIATTVLQATTHEAAVSSFGTVAGIDSLLEMRARYLTTRAESNVVRASIANSKQDYERLRLLNQDNRNVSNRAVAAAESAWKSEEARLNAGETATASLRDAMRQQWGETLADWATQQVPEEGFQRLIKRQDILLQVTLPIASATPSKNSTLQIEAPGQSNSIKAIFVSAAQQSDATIQGKTFYYRAPAEHLRAGMRVSTRLTADDKAQKGVIVPANAVVWYANQPWVYRKQGKDKFVRTPISTDTEVDDGWFNTIGIKACDAVVTTGAQLLLSEEFKYQIKNENED
jgi:hypothetical protein